MQDYNKTNPHAGGVSIVGVLTLIFFVLKITGLINWSWWWVFSPIWIYLLLFFTIALIAAVVIAVIQKEESRHKLK